MPSQTTLSSERRDRKEWEDQETFFHCLLTIKPAATTQSVQIVTFGKKDMYS